jgi:hypothetical protein
MFGQSVVINDQIAFSSNNIIQHLMPYLSNLSLKVDFFKKLM